MDSTVADGMTEKRPCASCQTPAETKCSSCKEAFYCSRSCQKSDWKTHRKSCRWREQREHDMVGDATPRVEVRSSHIHGRGVFATDHIHKGERVCYFNGEDKNVEVRVKMSRAANGELSILNASEVFTSMIDVDLDMCMARMDNKRKPTVRVGDPEPAEDGFGVGQFVNDARRPCIYGLRDFTEASDAVRQYQRASVERSNCEINPTDCWFKASRNIIAGEELLTHYGVEFWLQRILALEVKDPLQRLLCYSLQDQSTKPFDLRRFFDYDEQTCRTFLEVLVTVPTEELEESSGESKGLMCDLTEKIKLC